MLKPSNLELAIDAAEAAICLLEDAKTRLTRSLRLANKVEGVKLTHHCRALLTCHAELDVLIQDTTRVAEALDDAFIGIDVTEE